MTSVLAATTGAQINLTGYFMKNWSLRHELNASLTPDSGYMVFPVVGGAAMYIASNKGLSDFIYKYNNQLVTFLHPSVDGNRFMQGFTSDMYFRQQADIRLLSIGLSLKNSFITFECRIKENFSLNLPVDLFRLIKLGPAHSTNSFDLHTLQLQQSTYLLYSAGFSKKISPTLSVGAKLNLINGLSNEKIVYNQFDVHLSNQLYQININGKSDISSNILRFNTDNNNFNYSDYKLNMTGTTPAGIGLCVDLGTTWSPSKHFTLSTAINNVGFITWKGAATLKGIANGNVLFSGFKVVNIDSIKITSQLQQLANDTKSLIEFKKQPTPADNITGYFPFNFNFSTEYSLMANPNRDIRIGFIFSHNYYSVWSENHLIGAVTLQPSKCLSLTASYSILPNNNNRFGFAVLYSPKWVNIYFSVDNIANRLNPQLLPLDQFTFNFDAGISFYLGNDQ